MTEAELEQFNSRRTEPLPKPDLHSKPAVRVIMKKRSNSRSASSNAFCARQPQGPSMRYGTQSAACSMHSSQMNATIPTSLRLCTLRPIMVYINKQSDQPL